MTQVRVLRVTRQGGLVWCVYLMSPQPVAIQLLPLLPIVACTAVTCALGNSFWSTFVSYCWRLECLSTAFKDISAMKVKLKIQYNVSGRQRLKFR